MPSEIGTVASGDGLTLRTRRWRTEASPWAGLLVVHGVGEHSGRYERIGSALASAGIEVHGWDHRGFGASGGRPAWVDRWDRLLDDVDEALDRLRAAVPGRPTVLLGHSMGGLVALDHATSGRPTADLLVLSAPGLADDLAAWKHAIAPLLDPIVPWLRIPTGIRGEDVSRDATLHAADAADPLNRPFGTVRLGRVAFDAQDRVNGRVASLERMPMPTLVVHGTDDPVVPIRATETLGRLDGVTRWAKPGLRHECLNEPEGPAVLEEVVGWIGEQATMSGPAVAPIGESAAAPVPSAVPV